MKVSLALTGGIASGKSTAVRILRDQTATLSVFDCDAEVRLLLERFDVLDELRCEFGSDIFNPVGELDRSALRRRVFSSSTKRGLLENIIHPRLRAKALQQHAQWEDEVAEGLFLIDVPLLFENGFDFPYDYSVVVAVARATQSKRIRARNGFDDRLIDQIIEAQLPWERKVDLGDYVLWNEGPEAVLRSQIQILVAHLNTIHV